MGKKTQTREDKQYKIEVHVAGICLRYNKGDIEVLVARRQKDRELYPEKWECSGGQIKPGESFEVALKRQFFEEFGIKVRVIQPIRTYEIMPSNATLIPGLVFFCYPDGQGFEKIELNTREFSEYKWISIDEVKKLDIISGVKQDIESSVPIFKKYFVPVDKNEKTNKKRIGFQAPKEE